VRSTRKKKSPLQFWLSYLESVCRKLYNAGCGNDDGLYMTGVRITLAALFRRIAASRSLPPEPFAGCFLQPDDGIPLKAVAFPLSDAPGGHGCEAPDDPAFPGLFYGECLRYTPFRNNEGALILKKIPTRRGYGAYYTPDAITRFLARETLAPQVRGCARRDAAGIRVCDPAMGTGNFLAAAARYLSEIITENPQPSAGKSRRTAIPRSVIMRSLFGMDRDPVAVLTARAYFAVLCGAAPQQMTNFAVADSLLDPLPFEGGFDAVIGNPPWVSYGLRNTGKISGELRRIYREKFPHTAEYKIATYALFIERALSMTRAGGYHGFIVPDSWLAGRFFEKLRTFLLEQTAIQRLVLISDDFWTGLNIGKSVVYVVRKDRNGSRRKSFAGAVVPAVEYLHDVPARSVPVSVDAIRRRRRKRIAVYPDAQTRDIVERMENAGDTLGNHIRFYSGLIGRKGRDSIVIRGKPADYSPVKYGRLIESGRNLERDRLLFNDCYIRHDPALYKSGYDPEKYRNPKLFLNQTGYVLKSCYDDRGFFCLNNLHIGYPAHRDADIRFFVFLLNSRILNFYYSVMSMEQRRVLAQTDIDFVHQLPAGTDEGAAAEIAGLLGEQAGSRKTPDIHKKNAGFEPKDKRMRYLEELLERWYGISQKNTAIVYQNQPW